MSCGVVRRLFCGTAQWPADGVSVLAGGGRLLGLSLFVPLLINPDWLPIRIVRHSIDDNSRLIWNGIVSDTPLRGIYAGAACVPLPLSSARPVRVFGAASAQNRPGRVRGRLQRPCITQRSAFGRFLRAAPGSAEPVKQLWIRRADEPRQGGRRFQRVRKMLSRYSFSLTMGRFSSA